ncbi:MAG TPA: RNA 2',3'-cyclic phosphodiesterase [Longimicrobiales bacterium]|nr:RNA 2',3'-cyclic phosphodiesterase [Longimicrobiales bacterium]
MRTFVALNLPHGERVRLYDALEPLRDKGLPVRWIDADALHLTVKFLGDTEGPAVEVVDEVLKIAAARRSPLTLRIGGLGGFPSLRRANILWVGVVGDAELAALQRELEPALSRLGFPREQRPFRPHITIGRTRNGTKPLDIERMAGLLEYESMITVESVELMQSVMGPGGSRYSTVLRRPFGEKEDV